MCLTSMSLENFKHFQFLRIKTKITFQLVPKSSHQTRHLLSYAMVTLKQQPLIKSKTTLFNPIILLKWAGSSASLLKKFEKFCQAHPEIFEKLRKIQ